MDPLARFMAVFESLGRQGHASSPCSPSLAGHSDLLSGGVPAGQGSLMVGDAGARGTSCCPLLGHLSYPLSYARGDCTGQLLVLFLYAPLGGTGVLRRVGRALGSPRPAPGQELG